MRPMQPAFDGLAHVGEQVPAVGDLKGRGAPRLAPRAYSVERSRATALMPGRPSSQPASVTAVRSGRNDPGLLVIRPLTPALDPAQNLDPHRPDDLG